ncbi:MAG: VOC family protein [Candidatus Nanopelagicales bacterium]
MIRHLDHVGIVVEDLTAARLFFETLGLRVVGEARVEGPWVDQVIGVTGVCSEIVMLETADGHGRVELSRFLTPPGPNWDPQTPANAPGIRHIAFEVDDIDAALASLPATGAELVGEVMRYQDSYRLCYVRGPAGIIVELAERID